MKNWKIVVIVLLVIAIVGSAVVYYMWNKPQRNVENEKGFELTSAQLVKEFQTNEAEANKKYLDKVIQVTGVVTEMKDNQEGNSTITLASDDAFTGVFCTLKEKTAILNPGTSVTIKGICSGMLSDVRLREAVVVN